MKPKCRTIPFLNNTFKYLETLERRDFSRELHYWPITRTVMVFFSNCLEIFDAVVSPKEFSDRR
ncbi:hypothetical protein EYC95_10320 [Pseudomonas sp. BGI-2]|nr:hypothetical protein EYC95_10320 [Pseudomonas sp. BGI-2]